MKYCDDAKQEVCPHPDDCTIPCSRDFGSVMRKVKPYPEVPADPYVMLQHDFEDISRRLMWAAGAFLVVMVANLLLALYILVGLL